MRKKFHIFFILLLFSGLTANAQFYTTGNESAGIKWNQILTDGYKVIYPRGLDSLGLAYARALESCRIDVSLSNGFIPGQSYKKPTPVILHPYNIASNGVVTWTPRRMELMTTPNSDAPYAVPWMDQLAVHESRHVAQMQFARNGGFYNVMHYISGELFAGGMAALYGGPSFFEGDAVIAETELSPVGRGRSADFLEYYRVSFAEGQFRNYWNWRWSSQKNYTPSYYTIGYLSIAGARSVYDRPDVVHEFYSKLYQGWPLPFFRMERTLKEVSGKKAKVAFAEICDSLNAQWKKDEQLRGPFMEAVPSVEAPRRYTTWTSPNIVEGERYYLKSSIDDYQMIVSVDSLGEELVLCRVSNLNSRIKASGNRFWWSETRSDLRWDQVKWSVIRYCDLNGKCRDLSSRSRYFNPAPSPDAKKLCVVEYPENATSAIVILDASNGKVLQRAAVPSQYQAVECEWVGGDVLFTAISKEGFSLWRFPGACAEAKANDSCAPVKIKDTGFAKIKHLFSDSGNLYCTCDLNGVDELYRLYPGRTARLTNTRFGADQFCFDGDSLRCSILSTKGRLPYAISASSLIADTNDPAEVLSYPFADDLVHQLDSLDAEGPEWARRRKRSSDRRQEAYSAQLPDSSDIRKYSKAANAFKFHSWVPAFVNFNAIADLSYETLTTAAGVGATAFFQNDLSTLQGFVGYGAWTPESGWRNTLHGNLTYSGLYPVIEASFDLNDRVKRRYFMAEDGMKYYRYSDVPLFTSTIKLYVPFNFSSGAWSRGVIPTFETSIGNDEFTDASGKSSPLASYAASVRGYTMLGIPQSCIYPRLGIGAEIGANGYYQIAESLTCYGYLYGYLPGFWKTHGIKLTFYQGINLPKTMTTFTYALPFAPVDWTFLDPVAHIRNFEFYGKYTFYRMDTSYEHRLGFDLNVRFSNLLWIPYDTRMGVSCTFYPGLDKQPLISFLFSIAL